MTSTLRDRTRELLSKRPRSLTLQVIAEDTGLSFKWIEKLHQNKIEDPGVIRTQTLYEYLSGRKLEL